MKPKLFTSLNVDSFLKMEVENFCKVCNFNKDKIFKDLISKTILYLDSGITVYKLTEYQDHKPAEWTKVDYSLTFQEHEIYSCARQKYKMSVSKMLFIGFMLFWKELVFYYKARLMVSTISFSSYDDIRQEYNDFITYFKKRLNIIKKE